MIALVAFSAVWSMGTGAVHPEARTGSAGDGRPVGRAEPAGLAEPEAPPRCGGVLACGAEAWCRSSVSAPAAPTASTTSASVRASERPRRRPGRAGSVGLPRSPYGGRLASTSAWASRHGSGRPSPARAGWDLAGPPAGLNDSSDRSIGRVLVTPRGEPAGAGGSIGPVLGAFTSLPLASDVSPADGATIAGSSGTGRSCTDMAGRGSRGPGSAKAGDPGLAGSATAAGPAPAGSGGGGPAPATSAWSLRMKSVKDPLL